MVFHCVNIMASTSKRNRFDFDNVLDLLDQYDGDSETGGMSSDEESELDREFDHFDDESSNEDVNFDPPDSDEENAGDVGDIGDVDDDTDVDYMGDSGHSNTARRGRARGKGRGRGRGRGRARGRGRGSNRGRPRNPSRGRTRGYMVPDNSKSYEDPDVGNILPPFKPIRPPGVHFDHAHLRGTMTTAVEFFHLFFTTEMINSIVEHTNSYAYIKIAEGSHSSYTDRLGAWVDTDSDEINRLIALLLYFGFVKIGSDFEKYWSTKTLYHGLWARAMMTKKRFKALLAFLHVVDPTTEAPGNKLRKVESFLNHFKERCKSLFQPGQNMAVDERMIKSRHRSGIRQYIQNKPVKWGIKLWVLADSSNGYTVDFDVYIGRSASGVVSEHGLGYDVVMKLVQPFLNQGYHLFFDNFYTSHQLVNDLFLQGTPSTGTVKCGRKGFPDSLKDVKYWARKKERGAMRWERTSHVLALQWIDNKPVSVLTTIDNANDTVEVQQRGKRASDRGSVLSTQSSTSKVTILKEMESLLASRPAGHPVDSIPREPSSSRLQEQFDSIPEKQALQPSDKEAAVPLDVNYGGYEMSAHPLDEPDEEIPRDSWGHKAEFILASVGLAVGLGNVWRFPYLCQRNGGGAFLIPYVIFMFIEGIPLMILEFAIGQKMRMTAVRLWQEIHPALFGVGIGCVVVSLLLCVYYIVVIAWCLFYLIISLRKDLPWEISELCSSYPEYKALQNVQEYWRINYTFYENKLSYYNVSHPSYIFMSQVHNYSKNMYEAAKSNVSNFADCCVIDPPQWYFYTEMLKISSDIEDYGDGLNDKLVGCLILSWMVVYLCVVKGIKSSGKVVYFTATFPYVILLILFFRGVTLEGAANGLQTFIEPDLNRLRDVQVWKDAATQMFFTLSLGFGALIAFASYMPYKNQCINDAYVVVFVNCGTSIFAGVVVFSILGHRELNTGIPAADVGSGPGLAFMAFSDAFLHLDLSPLWAVLFFFMLILLGIDSEFGTLEATIGPMMEFGLFPKKMRKEICTGIVAVILLLIGLSMVAANGFYIFQIFDDYCATLPLLIIALSQCIAVAWVYGNDRFADDIEEMTGKRPWIGWMICWKYISPLALFIVLIATIYDLCQSKASYAVFVGCEQNAYSPAKYNGTKAWTNRMTYPDWAQFLVALVVLASTVPIIVFLVLKWPKNWREAFRNTFCSGIAKYHPDL